MKVIEISRSNINLLEDDLMRDKDLVDRYVDMLNGIVYDCYRGGYCSGYRNQVAVDLTVGCYMMGLDALDVLSDLEDASIIDRRWDDEYPEDRVKKVLEYRYAFDWDWMINPEQYVDCKNIETYDEAKLPVVFKLVD